VRGKDFIATLMFKEYIHGQLYTFYEGDKEFSNCPGIRKSVRTLQKMKDNPARIKDRGRVLWVKEIYFENLLRGISTHLIKRTKRNNSSGTKKLKASDFEVIQGGRV